MPPQKCFGRIATCSYAMCSMRHPLLFVPPTHHFLTHPGDGFGVGLNLHGLGAQGLLLWGSHLLDHHLYIVIAVLIGVVTGIVGHDRGDRSRWMGWHLFFPFLLVANPVLRHGHIPVLIVDACLWRVRGCAGVCPLCLWLSHGPSRMCAGVGWALTHHMRWSESSPCALGPPLFLLSLCGSAWWQRRIPFDSSGMNHPFGDWSSHMRVVDVLYVPFPPRALYEVG